MPAAGRLNQGSPLLVVSTSSLQRGLLVELYLWAGFLRPAAVRTWAAGPADLVAGFSITPVVRRGISKPPPPEEPRTLPPMAVGAPQAPAAPRAATVAPQQTPVAGAAGTGAQEQAAMEGLAPGTALVVAVVVQLTPLQQGSWWQESGSAVLLSAALKELRPTLPADFGRHLPS